MAVKSERESEEAYVSRLGLIGEQGDSSELLSHLIHTNWVQGCTVKVTGGPRGRESCLFMCP